MVEFINTVTESQASDKVHKILRADPDKKRNQSEREKSEAEKKEEAAKVADKIVLSEAAEIKAEIATSEIEFIDFQSKGKKDVTTKMNPTGEFNQFEKNRLKIIKQAREMLNGSKINGKISRNAFVNDSGFQAANQGRMVIANRGAANDQ